MLRAFCLGFFAKELIFRHCAKKVLIDLGTWCQNVDFEAFSQKN